MVQQWGVATAERQFVGGNISGNVTIDGDLSVTGETTTDDLTSTGVASIDGADLSFPNMPATDPAEAGQAWADSDVVTISDPA